MAESFTQTVADKTGHISNRLMNGLKKGAKIGAIVGVGLGLFTLFASTSILTMGASNIIMGAIGYSIIGAMSGAVSGSVLGGVLGGVKGLITRARPQGEQIMSDAEQCLPGLQPQQGMAPQVQPQIAPSQATPAAGPAASGGKLPQEAVADLERMTKTLNEIQANAAVSNAAQATQQPAAANWQQRVHAQSQAQAQQTGGYAK
jgi:hypothetical protein